MSIVKMYDIRGVYGSELTTEYAYKLGIRLANYLNSKHPLNDGHDRFVMIGHDFRESSPELHDALADALSVMGIGVASIGECTSGILYTLDKLHSPDASIMITASHLPLDHNGFKVIVKGEFLSGDGLKELANFVDIKFSCVNRGLVSDESKSVLNGYVPLVASKLKDKYAKEIEKIDELGDVKFTIASPSRRTTKVLLHLLGEVGIKSMVDVDIDPNLIHSIDFESDESTNLHFSMDPDGDRIGVRTLEGELTGDQVVMIPAFANRQRGEAILLDVKSSMYTRKALERIGFSVAYHETGHSLIKKTMNRTPGISMAAEESGHVYLKDDFYGMDDAIYNILRVLLDSVRLGIYKDVFGWVHSKIPQVYRTEFKRWVDLSDELYGKVEEALHEYARSLPAYVWRTNGVRAELDKVWFSVRRSNTEPYISILVEGTDFEEVDKYVSQLRYLIDDVTETSITTIGTKVPPSYVRKITGTADGIDPIFNNNILQPRGDNRNE